MDGRRLAFLLAFLLPAASRAEEPAAASEMVEVEVRFFEVTNEQAGKLPPGMGDMAGADELIRGLMPRSGGSQGLAPAILSVNGIFTAEQADQWLRQLKATGAKPLVQQKTVVLSGRKTRLQNVRELRYPSEFETSKSGVKGLYPTTFAAKNVGFQLELEPKIGPDGFTIDLMVSPRIDEFRGFIDTTKVQEGTPPEEMEELLKAPKEKGAALQPVFSSRKVTTSVTLYSGQTLLMSSAVIGKESRMVILVTARVLPPL